MSCIQYSKRKRITLLANFQRIYIIKSAMLGMKHMLNTLDLISNAVIK